MSSNVPARVAAGSAEADRELANLAAALAQANAPAGDPTGTPPADPAPAPAPAPTPAPAPVQPVNEEYLRQSEARMNSLLGRQEQLITQNAQLQQQLAASEAARAAAAAAPTPAPTPQRSVTDADLSEFGDETIGMVRRVFADEARPLMQQLQQLQSTLSGMEGRVQRTTEQFGQVAARAEMTEKQQYIATLGEAVPDWEAVNVDPAFEAWLAHKDPLSGHKRHDLLIDAHKKLDAGRVIAIFTAYKQGLETGTPPAAAHGQPPAAVDPAFQVAPNTTAAAPAPASGVTGKVYTASDYDTAHNDMMRGRMPKAEFQAFEKEYFKAMNEGRVRV